MTTSEQINELSAALAKAQGAVEGAAKSSANPFFKSKYADLASVWEACRKPLADNGLAVVQSPEADNIRVTVTTRLLHSSGQWLEGVVGTEAKDASPQAIGSAITYLRRYALQSFVGVAPEDDDAEAAQGRGKRPEPPAEPEGYGAWLDDLSATADEGTKALETAWRASKPDYRRHLQQTDLPRWNALKARASKQVAA
jgi:hypothetical protein